MRNAVRKLCSALLVAVLCASAHASEGLKVETFTLANGLEVIVIPNHRIPAVSHMLWLRVGSADDPQGKSGLAHYHEHMMFQGTAKYKSGEYSDIIARHGGEQNAFTGYDATSYYVDIAKEELPLVMEMEADRMRGITPSDADSAKEKQVIIEERRQRTDNNPEALLREQVNAALFRHHPYHIPVIGWMHEMEGLTKQDVLDFHRTYYHPNNAILIVSGDITAEELKPLAQKYYGGFKAGVIPKREWKREPPQNSERRITLRHVNVKQPSWSRSYAADSVGSGKKENALPLFALAQVLASGKSSRLYRSLVVEQKLATAVDADYSPFSIGPADFTLSALPENGISMEVLEEAVDKQIELLLKTGITEEELARAKTQLKAESIFERDGLSETARLMGWIRITGEDAHYFERWPELVDNITAEQIIAAARDALKMNQSVTAQLLPETKTP